MRTKSLLLFLVFSIICSSFMKGNDGDKKENVSISKINYKINYLTERDTLRVFQNDPSVFKRTEDIITRPCSNPEPTIRYELINPQDNAYYLIYNDKKQLVLEGVYTPQYTYEGILYKNGDFYNSKTYSYTKNGDLDTVHYMEDGRNLKTEYFDTKIQLTKIRYLDKKSGELSRIELYKNGHLKETRTYVSFNKYTTVKAK